MATRAVFPALLLSVCTPACHWVSGAVSTGGAPRAQPVNVSTNPTPPPERHAPPPTEGPAADEGTGTLNMNSIPVSHVVLDDKPLGSTPKFGVSVPAGSHTVTFIAPDATRKSLTLQVKNGETKTAAVKF